MFPHLLAEFVDGDSTLKKRTGLGRFFKNMGVRRSGRKYVYKQHAGDLHASQITMPDEERIELMLLVKEGKLSMHDAVETVSIVFIMQLSFRINFYNKFLHLMSLFLGGTCANKS